MFVHWPNPLDVLQKFLKTLLKYPQVKDINRQGTCTGLTGVRIALSLSHSNVLYRMVVRINGGEK